MDSTCLSANCMEIKHNVFLVSISAILMLSSLWFWQQKQYQQQCCTFTSWLLKISSVPRDRKAYLPVKFISGCFCCLNALSDQHTAKRILNSEVLKSSFVRGQINSSLSQQQAWKRFINMESFNVREKFGPTLEIEVSLTVDCERSVKFSIQLQFGYENKNFTFQMNEVDLT